MARGRRETVEMSKPAERELFLNDLHGPGRYIMVSFVDPENEDNAHVELAAGESVIAVLAAFGAQTAELCGDPPDQVAEWLVSGKDYGLWFCPDADSRKFLSTISDPGLRIAAFYLCESDLPLKRVEGAGAYTEGLDEEDESLEEKYPDYDVLYCWEAMPPHQDEAVWVMRCRS